MPAYREHPELVVQRLWMEMYGRVLSRDDVEIFFAPAGGGSLKVSVAGLDHIRETRRENMLQLQKSEAINKGARDDPHIRWGRDRRDGPGRQLSETGESLNKDR